VPTTELSANGWPSAPVRARPAASATRRSEASVAWLGPCPLAGLGDGLTGDGARQSEAPGLPGACVRGAPGACGRVCTCAYVRARAPMVDAMREACQRVFSAQGRSASLASKRVTDFSAGCGVPLPGARGTGQRPAAAEPWGRCVRTQPCPVGCAPRTRRRGRAGRPRPLGPSAGHAPAIEEPALRLQPPSRSVPGSTPA